MQAIGLALYEEVEGTSAEMMGREVVRTQWLDEGTFKKSFVPGDNNKNNLLGKNVLIVDEVDDSRLTLQYAYQELLKDVQKGLASLSPEQREKLPPTRCECKFFEDGACAARVQTRAECRGASERGCAHPDKPTNPHQKRRIRTTLLTTSSSHLLSRSRNLRRAQQEQGRRQEGIAATRPQPNKGNHPRVATRRRRHRTGRLVLRFGRRDGRRMD